MIQFNLRLFNTRQTVRLQEFRVSKQDSEKQHLYGILYFIHESEQSHNDLKVQPINTNFNTEAKLCFANTFEIDYKYVQHKRTYALHFAKLQTSNQPKTSKPAPKN